MTKAEYNSEDELTKDTRNLTTLCKAWNVCSVDLGEHCVIKSTTLYHFINNITATVDWAHHMGKLKIYIVLSRIWPFYKRITPPKDILFPCTKDMSMCSNSQMIESHSKKTNLDFLTHKYTVIFHVAIKHSLLPNRCHNWINTCLRLAPWGIPGNQHIGRSPLMWDTHPIPQRVYKFRIQVL